MYKEGVVMVKGYVEGWVEVGLMIVMVEYGYREWEIGGVRVD